MQILIRALMITAGLMIIPAVASQFVEGWLWSTFDYFFAAVFIFFTAALFEFGRTRSKNLMYRAGFGLALFTGFGIIWGNLAVGFIGSEENPINLIYLGILMVGFLAAIATRFQARSMSKIMYGVALGVALVPVIALVTKTTFNEIPEAAGPVHVIMLNSIFVFMFIASGILFKHSVQDQVQSA